MRTARFATLVLVVIGCGFGFTAVAPRASAEEVEAVDDATCLACHDGMEVSLRGGPHELASMQSRPATNVACAGCHTGAAVHVEDPSADNIGNPAKALPAETERVCTSCHRPHTFMGVAGIDPHIGQDVSCTSCHRIHGGSEAPLIDKEGLACRNCHVAVVNQFRQRSNHPLTDQAVTCLSCHSFVGSGELGFGHGAGATCATCHAEQSGPFRFEHEATSSFSTQGESCTSCHRPHGSPNDRLLVQPAEQLCLQCHGVPPLHRVRHDGIGTRYACLECHSDVHGSYDNSAFLDPLLGTKLSDNPRSCYCHGVGE